MTVLVVIEHDRGTLASASLEALAAAARAAGFTDALPGMVARIGEHLELV